MFPQDVLLFARAWRADPRRIGAIAPSGQALAELITSQINAGSGPVIELGPGTGAFTRMLLERGVKEEDLTLVEHGPNFVALLQSRFPKARVLRVDAAQLGKLDLGAGAPVGAVVSGLPLLNMSTRQILAILTGAFAHIRADGGFYQFTYGPRCPVPKSFLDRLGLRATRVGRTLLNVPPATVYRIMRRKFSRFAPV